MNKEGMVQGMVQEAVTREEGKGTLIRMVVVVKRVVIKKEVSARVRHAKMAATAAIRRPCSIQTKKVPAGMNTPVLRAGNMSVCARWGSTGADVSSTLTSVEATRV